MSYIQNNLQPGEEVKYRADIHWYVFLFPAVLLLLGAWFYAARSGFFHYVGIFLLVGGVYQGIKRFFVKVGTECLVTNKKVVLKSGVFGRDALELLVDKCEGIRITQSAAGRLFGFGSIVVTTGGVTNVFRFITNPLNFKNAINAQAQVS